MLSLEKLRKPLTRTQAMTRITEWLTALGFETTGWQEGRIQKTFFTILSLVWSDASEVVKALAEFGFNSFASGDAMNEFSKSRFDNEKDEAVKTRGPMTLRSTASVPYTIEVGQLIASTDAGVQFRNVTGGVLSAGSVATPSTLVLTWDALVAGNAGNVPLNGVTRLVTALAGVTIANDQGTPWYTIAGADEESDASIEVRNSTKWSTLTVELVAESYENIARTNGARKVLIDATNPRGPGTIDVYSAAENGLLGAPAMATIQAAFAARAFQTDTAWVTPWPTGNTSRVANRHPSTLALNVTATLYHSSNVAGSVIVQRARDKLAEFLRVTPIGGWDYSPGPNHVITREDLVDVLKDVEGMRTVTLVTPSAVINVATLALVIEGAWTLTPVAVAS